MKHLIRLSAGLMVMAFLALPLAGVQAKTTEKLPSTWTYVYEWLDLHILTWKSSTKVAKLTDYATQRTQNIVTAAKLGNGEALKDLTARYTSTVNEINDLLTTKTIANKTALVARVESNTLTQQRLLSTVRQATPSDAQKQLIATVQEQSTNEVRQTISTVAGADTAETFVTNVVGAWRDPAKTVTEEKATRVYATGTTATGHVDNNGVIIDGGQAKVTQGTTGELKIEYAPGTGPSSTVTGDGKHVWKIQMADGTTVDSYTSGGTVVVGQAGGTVSNIVVNTVSGGTSTTKQVIAGNGQSGTSGVTVVGGPATVAGGTAGTSGTTVQGSNPGVVGGTTGSSGTTVVGH